MSQERDPGTLNRRHALKIGLTAAAASAAAASVSSTAVAQVCSRTPAQPKGPFYPVDERLDKDADLTRFEGQMGVPLGQAVYITGTLQDAECNPVSGALVEIWQACASGRYDHPNDTSGLALDPNFQYWGQAVTGADGKYLFKTIIPGSYPAGDGWVRPPHIHYRVSKRGYRELITQLYFAGDPLNDRDLILRNVPATERSRLITSLTSPSAGMDPNAKLGKFDITLIRVI